MKKLLKSRDGNVAVTFALVLVPIVISFGVAIDYSRVSRERWNLQESVDSAALAAAALEKTNAEKLILGQKVYQLNSRNPCSNEAAITVGGGEVTVSAECVVDTTFMGIVGQTELAISASATATWMGASGPAGCIFALNTGNTSQALEFGSIDMADLDDCTPVSNSTHFEGIKLSSINNFNASSLYSAGGYNASSIGSLQLDEPAQTNQPQVPDPYGDLSDPSDGITCINTGTKSGAVYGPGNFCGDLDISGNTITFLPGTYYIVNGSLKINSAITVRCECSAPGSGVTFVLTGTTPSKIGKLEIGSINSFHLNAPADPSYDYPGILFYVDRDAENQESKFESIISFIGNGAIYAPSHDLTFGSFDAGDTDCGQIIGSKVKFNSVERFAKSQNCTSYGARNLKIGTDLVVRLVD